MKIPPLKVQFSKTDRKEILRRIDEALSTGYVVMGKNVEEFEKEFAAYCRSKHAVAVSSGSSALEIVMRALHVKNREVLIPANTFFSTASAVLFAGGKVRLVDVNPETFSLDIKNLKKRVTGKSAGVIIVHIGGIISPEIEEIRDWCDKSGLWLIEDAAHAHGSELYGKKAGKFGLGGCYSFFSTKVITSGEGGMVITDDDKIAHKIRLLRNHGKPEPWVSYHSELGSNWRMTEFSAAVGLVHLRNLDKFIAWRKKIADIYTKLLEQVKEVTPVLPAGECSWYKYIALLDKNINRKKLKSFLKEKGVSLSGEVYEIPLHKQPVLRNDLKESFPSAEYICDHHICLPLYFGMTEEEAVYVIDNLKQTIKNKEVLQ